MHRSLLRLGLPLALSFSTPAAAATVAWVDWDTVSPETAEVFGTAVTEDGTVVDVTYTGEWGFVQTACEYDDFWRTNWWTPVFTQASAYLGGGVDNAPNWTADPTQACDLIALHLATEKTLTFSEPVTNPIFAVVSLNGNGYRFDRDFEILGYGEGVWGSGTLTKQITTHPGGTVTYDLIGSGEPHGTIQFVGTFSTVTWTSLSNEYWNGFNIAIENVAAAVPPEIEVTAPTGALVDGQAAVVDIGTANVGESVSVTFTITNTGTGPLNFGGVSVVGASDFSASTLVPAIDAGASTTFAVSYTPTAGGDAAATVYVYSDDEDEAEFSFPITATGISDSDGDGVDDPVDACPGFDDLADEDCDGTPDGCDACPSDVENDADDDGICEIDDNCPDDANANQANADGDAYGDVCEPDDDSDGTIDDWDNCPLDANPGQADYDGDGIGDACDGDVDGDGVLDADDTCLGTAPGEVALDNGCSVDQECACDAAWKNHGAYVSCVARATNALVSAGAITSAEKDAIQSEAGASGCGQRVR